MLKNLAQTFKDNCNAREVRLSEYIVLDNIQIPVKAELNDDCYNEGNFIGTFIFKELRFETSNEYDFKKKEFKYYKVVNGESVKIGTFITTEITDNDTEETIKVVAMDYGLKTQVEYTSKLNYGSGNVTLLDVWNENCEMSGLKSGITSFTNSDFIVDSDQFSGTGATRRDVFIAIAQSSCDYVKVANDDKIYLVLSEETDEVIEEYTDLEDKRDTQPINAVSLGMSQVEGEVVTKIADGVSEKNANWLVINDNPFAYNQEKRQQLINGIFNKINGFGYSAFKTETSFKPYLTCGDLVKFKRKDGILVNSIILRYKHNFDNITLEAPSITKATVNYVRPESAIDIAKRTEFIVDKQNQEIQVLASKVVPVSNTIKNVKQIQLENAYEGILHYLSIKGNISLLYPSSQEALYGYGLTPSETLTPGNTLTPSTFVPKDNEILYPSNDLFSRSNVLLIDDVEYDLDFNFLNYMNNDDCDEFIYEDGKCKIIRRLGVNDNGELYKLANEIIEFRNDITLEVKSNSLIKLKSFDNAVLSSTYLLQNEYTDNFVPSVDVISRINLSPGNVQIEASKLAQITADKINLEGYTTINNGFSVDVDGNMTCNDATIKGSAIVNGENFNVDVDGNMTCNNATITGGDITLYTKNQNTAKITIGQENTSLYTEVTPAGYQCNAKGILSASYYWNGVFLNSAISNTKSIFNDGGISFRNGDTLMTYMNSEGIVGAYTYNNLSLESKKKNFEKFNNALSIISDIDLYKYNYKHEADGSKKHIGFVIGENYNYSSEITSLNDKGEEIGADLYSMASLCLQAIKEQQTLIEELKREIKQLKESESDK